MSHNNRFQEKNNGSEKNTFEQKRLGVKEQECSGTKSCLERASLQVEVQGKEYFEALFKEAQYKPDGRFLHPIDHHFYNVDTQETKREKLIRIEKYEGPKSGLSGMKGFVERYDVTYKKESGLVEVKKYNQSVKREKSESAALIVTTGVFGYGIKQAIKNNEDWIKTEPLDRIEGVQLLQRYVAPVLV